MLCTRQFYRLLPFSATFLAFFPVRNQARLPSGIRAAHFAYLLLPLCSQIMQDIDNTRPADQPSDALELCQPIVDLVEAVHESVTYRKTNQ
jgi:hypothetical protein